MSVILYFVIVVCYHKMEFLSVLLLNIVKIKASLQVLKLFQEDLYMFENRKNLMEEATTIVREIVRKSDGTSTF